jgi:epoxide hydrolase 4
MPELEHSYVPTNGIRLHVVKSGPDRGPLVLLIHGYPEFWYGWRHQIKQLAQAGFRVWALDQRGYNLSDKPRAINAYHRDELTRDVLGLIDAAGRERCSIVGHDLGGAVGWWLAAKHAQRVEKLCVLNMPHHRVIARALCTDPRQFIKSWYAFYFLIPGLPERLSAFHDWHILKRALRTTSLDGTFSDDDLSLYKQAWAQPAAHTSMVNHYRASMRAAFPTADRIAPRTLVLWGARDAFLREALAHQSMEFCDRGRLVVMPGASHWLQHEDPARVNRALVEFLRER